MLTSQLRRLMSGSLMLRTLISGFLTVLCAAGGCLCAQEPPAGASHSARPGQGDTVTAAAVSGSKQDPAAVGRGGQVFATYCAGCHGVAAKGGPGAPDLVRSLLVLDDEKGILIAPVIREGRPDKGMPKLNLTEAQIGDIVAWLHVRTYAAGHRGTYTFGDVVTGNAKQGEAYFNGAGKCSTCHSASGDLAGIGHKYDPFSLQSRWLQPRNSTRGSGGPAGSGAPASSHGGPTVTVTVTYRTANRFLARLIASTISTSRCATRAASFTPSLARVPRPRLRCTIRCALIPKCCANIRTAISTT